MIFWDYFVLVIYSADVSRHVDTGRVRLLCCVLFGGEMDPFHVSCACTPCVCVRCSERGARAEKEGLAGGVVKS